MANATLDAATPDLVDDLDQTLTWISSEDVDHIIISLDEQFAEMRNSCINGQYIKVDKVSDIILDVRSKLRALT